MEIIVSELASKNKIHPEIVLCVKDDNARAISFCKNYSDDFYLVFLCDGDFHNLLEYARSRDDGKISIFRRVADGMLTEDYFVNYLKGYSPSGCGIFLCTDEVIDSIELQMIFEAEGGYVITITRRDYINGLFFKEFKGIIRGGSADKLLFSRMGPHQNIEHMNNSKTFNIVVGHYSVADLSKEFGKILNYVEMELKYNSDRLWRFVLRRYVLNLARDILHFKMLFHAGSKTYIWNILMNTLVLTISLILIIERNMQVRKFHE